MPRTARERSKTGIYHVMTKGVAGQNIFVTDEDRLFYLRLLRVIKGEQGLSVHAYCLMGNHVHLLLAEGNEPIGDTMRRLGVSYALWFNTRYGRTGYVFQGRYRSHAIEDDSYFLAALRYILQNPVKAGLSQGIHDYRWSSHAECFGRREQVSGLVTTELVHGLFPDTAELLGFLVQPTVTLQHQIGDFDAEQKTRLTDDSLREHLQLLLPNWVPGDSLVSLSIDDRRKILRQLKAIPGVRTKQIARVAGVTRNMVQRDVSSTCN